MKQSVNCLLTRHCDGPRTAKSRRLLVAFIFISLVVVLLKGNMRVSIATNVATSLLGVVAKQNRKSTSSIGAKKNRSRRNTNASDFDLKQNTSGNYIADMKHIGSRSHASIHRVSDHQTELRDFDLGGN